MADDSAPVESPDPRVLDTVAVHAEDVVTAYEARIRSGRTAVLRMTPPFSARMRARIHVHRPGEYDEQDPPHPIHLDPRDLVATDCPAYPEPAETAAEADRSGAVPDPEAHYDRHRDTVAQWRQRAREHVRETVEIDVGDATHPVDVSVLG